MIFAKEHTQNTIKAQISHRRKERGLNDLLSYLVQLDDSTVLHKDGAISRHFKYVAPDLESSTDSGLDFNAQTWASAFNFLGNGWMVETNVASEHFGCYSNPQEFPEIVSALIDDERRLQYQQGQYFKTTYYLSVTWKPEQLIASKLRQFALEGHDESDEGFDEQLTQFDRTLSEYIGYLSRSLISIAPLKDYELTTFLHYCINHNSHKLAKPDVGYFLDCYVSDDFTASFQPMIGNKHITALCIDDLPSYSYPCILEELSFLPIEYRWSSRFICLDRLTAKSYLKRYERSWSSKAIGVLGILRESMGMDPKIDEDAQATAYELKAAQMESASGQAGYGFYNSNIILMDEDKGRLDKIAAEIIKRIQQLDFKVREESVNAVESYLGSLPCHGDYNLRKMLQNAQFVGHAFPTSSIYQGAPVSPCDKAGYKGQPALMTTSTRGSRPFSLNLHVGDVGHTAILGPTGMGKSTLNALLIASHRKYPSSRIIVLDKDRSNYIPIKALGGQYIDIEQDEQFQLGPLARVCHENPAAIERAVEWLMGCCMVQGVDVTPERQKRLREAVERLAKEDQQFKNLNHVSIQDPELRDAITALNSGQYQRILNGTGTNSYGYDILGIEMSSLIKSDSKDRDLAIPVIKAVFNELEEQFKDKRPTLLVLEEAWLYLRHKLFRDKITDWFKTLRKANVAVILISQDIDDIVTSGAASVIQSSCMTRIYLPNKSISEDHIAEQYRTLGLNDQQIQIIGDMTPKQDYYYHSEYGNRVFQLDLSELSKSFLCVSEKDDLCAFTDIYTQDHPQWILHWLNHKGLHQWHDFAAQHYFTQELNQ